MTDWLTTAEAALHVRAKDDRLIRQAVKDGDLPASRYRRSEMRIDRDELDAWMKSRTWEPRSA